jgi:hypothetical protein
MASVRTRSRASEMVRASVGWGRWGHSRDFVVEIDRKEFATIPSVRSSQRQRDCAGLYGERATSAGLTVRRLLSPKHVRTKRIRRAIPRETLPGGAAYVARTVACNGKARAVRCGEEKKGSVASLDCSGCVRTDLVWASLIVTHRLGRCFYVAMRSVWLHSSDRICACAVRSGVLFVPTSWWLS